MREPDASACPAPDTLRSITALLRDDDLDAAIEAGLMGDWPDTCADALDEDARAVLLAARLRLRTAWEARARFESRNARLARRAAERDAARRAAAAPVVSATPDAPSARPALPAGAAAILARAKARAGGGTP